ncbi:MAG: hydroxyacid dehydrogenase [Casimicrobiaceae bacterium]
MTHSPNEPSHPPSSDQLDHSPLNAGFLLAPFAFDDVYGEECLTAVRQVARVLLPIATRDDVNHHRVPWLDKVDLLFTGWGAPRLDDNLLQRMPRLKAVFFGAGSVRDLITNEFWERGIILTSAALVNARPVAEFALGAILLGLKRVWHQAREVRARRGYPDPPLSTPGAYRSIVGVVSYGAIGQLLCELLRPFDVQIIVYDPYVTNGVLEAQHHIRARTLEELFSTADVISLHTPLLPATERLITGALISSMKYGATLVNTARGAIVREEELASVLDRRTDLQAILDVTWPEPPPTSSALYDLPNVFITPHIAGSMGLERRRIGKAMVAEMQNYLEGNPLRFRIERLQSALRA